MIDISFEDTIETPEVIELYKANDWSSADRPAEHHYFYPVFGLSL